jgi:cyclic beta-1,2-glucan synthetase
MANPTFGAVVSESGSGCSWYGNSQSNRLTSWNNDPIADPPSEAIYIRDEASGAFWTPTALPVRELDAYRARHGQGYTEIEHNSHGLEQSLLTFTPVHADRDDPIRVQRLRIRNSSPRARRLSITAYAELVLGTDRESTQMHVTCNWDQASGALLARNPYHRDYGTRVAFAAISPEATAYTSDRTEFLGRNGSLEAPAALRRVSLSNRSGAGLDPCAALQCNLELAAGETIEIVSFVGQSESAEEARALIVRYRETNLDLVLAEVKDHWEATLGAIQVRTPDRRWTSC